ncbi:MAG: F0F1 ATP synthase subunit epsilon [Flavobacteriales bacterium]|nr:F0F1 ATP synthase subunit epsilon [Flavobacteriales bacterium]
MQLDIITPEKKVYSGEVDMVNLPGSDGSFGILKDHAPIVSTLKAGHIKVLQAEGGKNHMNSESGELVRDMSNDKELTFEIKGGVVEVNNNKIIVLAE